MASGKHSRRPASGRPSAARSRVAGAQGASAARRKARGSHSAGTAQRPSALSRQQKTSNAALGRTGNAGDMQNANAMGPAANMGNASNDRSAGSPSTLVSRRRFLYGAIGVGAVAAVGVGAAAYSSSRNSGSSDVSYLQAPASALTSLNDLTALDTYEGSVQSVGEYDIPYGSLVWANDDSVAACLLPTETGSPLTQVGLLYLTSGRLDTVLSKAVGSSDSFEIYDVRANSEGLVWTEANILQGTWRVYAASLSSEATMGTPQLLEEGDDHYDTPMLAVAGSRAIWLANPKSPRDDNLSARLMAAAFSGGEPSCLCESTRRMGTPPYSSDDSVTIAVREDLSSVYYRLTNINTTTGQTTDTLTLPRAVAPTEAGYGRTGFMFSLPDIYDYEGAVSNLGTYAPVSMPSNGDYDNARWFDFARTPTAAPAWCDDLLIVKSTYAVCGIDLNAGTYFAIDVENGADTYGEYLASTGTHDTFVTYTNIDHTPIGEAAIHTCRVKVWAALTAQERQAYQATQAEQETTEA